MKRALLSSWAALRKRSNAIHQMIEVCLPRQTFTSASFIIVSLTISEYIPYTYIFRGVKLLIMVPNSLLRWHRRHLRCPQLPSINFRLPWSTLSTHSWYHHHLLHLTFTRLSLPVRFVSWQSQTLYFPLGLLASPQVRYSSSSAWMTKYWVLSNFTISITPAGLLLTALAAYWLVSYLHPPGGSVFRPW